MRFPGDDKSSNTRYFVAAEDAVRLSEDAGRLLDHAVGVDWYELPGSDVDRAALTLCRLRRAGAGDKGGPRHGDEAVRLAIAGASAPALVWLVSRAVSYMDESGYPEAVEPWFPEEAD